MTIEEILEEIGEKELKGADLRAVDLRGANLAEADLRGVNLRGTVLVGADFRGADLREANLMWADLREANLVGANLVGANLRGADLDGAGLEGAILPDGSNLETYDPKPLFNGRKIPAEAWHCHSWKNCPLHHAYNVNSIGQLPDNKQAQAALWLALFDGNFSCAVPG